MRMARRIDMHLTRRGALALGAGFAAAAILPAAAARAAVDEAIAAFTGGAAVGDAGVTLTTPEIAENGNTVPVTVSAPGAVAILLVAAGNPSPGVCTISFGPLAASQSASTRIRLATTQDVIAVARMADGSFARASNEVKVTIGGCGG
jgi:sulfur-oxidizing protein SoxY